MSPLILLPWHLWYWWQYTFSGKNCNFREYLQKYFVNRLSWSDLLTNYHQNGNQVQCIVGMPSTAERGWSLGSDFWLVNFRVQWCHAGHYSILGDFRWKSRVGNGGKSIYGRSRRLWRRTWNKEERSTFPTIPNLTYFSLDLGPSARVKQCAFFPKINSKQHDKLWWALFIGTVEGIKNNFHAKHGWKCV